MRVPSEERAMQSVTRGRLSFGGAPKRLEIYKLINGKLSSKEIARTAGRSLSAVLHDIEELRDIELIREKKNDLDLPVKKDGSTVYEKNPVIRHMSLSYFQDVAETSRLVRRPIEGKSAGSRSVLHVPTDNEVLDICKNGETQLYEFKAPGTDSENITREVSGFLHTRNGGVVFYGVDDAGSILGTDLRRQDLDQRVHNSVRNTISPPPTVEVIERNVMGAKILLILVPPWDRRTIYQNTKDNRYYVRKGTNVFAVRPDEMKKLNRGEYIA